MRTGNPTAREPQLRRFGRKDGCATAALDAPQGLASDLRLFALTFVGGFIFVSVFLA